MGLVTPWGRVAKSVNLPSTRGCIHLPDMSLDTPTSPEIKHIYCVNLWHSGAENTGSCTSAAEVAVLNAVYVEPSTV